VGVLIRPRRGTAAPREARRITQLTFQLAGAAAYGRSDFIVTASNSLALAWLDRWPDWPAPVLLLHGPEGSGKTHLAHLWRERASAALVSGVALDEAGLRQLLDYGNRRIAVDDADRAGETALLHLFNTCYESGSNLLLTSRTSPGSWRVALADLGSRLRAALAVGIGRPDDALLGAVLAKHFADRQIRVALEVIAYLVGHMERSLAAAAEVAAALDQLALSNGGAITVPLASRFLAERDDQSLRPDSDAAVT
jgi:chromosomal replication initiation ATPase DnaA